MGNGAVLVTLRCFGPGHPDGTLRQLAPSPTGSPETRDEWKHSWCCEDRNEAYGKWFNLFVREPDFSSLINTNKVCSLTNAGQVDRITLIIDLLCNKRNCGRR